MELSSLKDDECENTNCRKGDGGGGVSRRKVGREHGKGGSPSLWLERGPKRGCLVGKRGVANTNREGKMREQRCLKGIVMEFCGVKCLMIFSL